MVKVEMLRDKQRKILALAFETSDLDGQEVVDAVRTALLGSFPREGGYVNSNRFVVHIKVDEATTSQWE
jgi:hypothetical protein